MTHARKGNARGNRAIRAVVAICLAWIVAPATAQIDYSQPGDAAFGETLRASIESGGRPAVLAQLTRYPDRQELAELERLGLRLQQHLGANLWRVSLLDTPALGFGDPSGAEAGPVLRLVEGLRPIRVEDKLTPELLTDGVFDKHRYDDGTIEVKVGFYSDVSAATVDRRLARHGARRMADLGILGSVVVRVPEDRLLALAGEDIVAWIEKIAAGDSGSNDTSRAAIGSDAVGIGTADDLTGANVQVGIWDEGAVDSGHDDLTGRITLGAGEPAGVSDHATHVGGTLAGDGTLSAGNQWRGVAPSVGLFTFSIADPDNEDDEVEEHEGAMASGIDLSQNSWGHDPSCYLMGRYDDRSRGFDRLVRGIYPAATPRPLPVVFAAGNNGVIGGPPCGAGGAGTAPVSTLRVPGATAKNTIVVGSVSATSPHLLASTSSRGPTNFGMLKPDIVAPGCSDAACGTGITSTMPGDMYGPNSGTSMAAPAVSGAIALLLEQYRTTYFPTGTGDEAPLPSTFKAILIQSATDLWLPGPDYDYGYGLIAVDSAVQIVKEQRIAEGALNNTGDADVYAVTVPAGATELRVTLAWDDYASAVNAGTGMAQVENDLNLLVTNPTHNDFYTPWKLDPANRFLAATQDIHPTEAAADTHADTYNHNVVEQVVISAPAAGLWKVKVKARGLNPFSDGQTYSLVADSQPLGPEVDIVQVLDKSGSMSQIAAAAGTDTKLQVMQSASKLFVNLMDTGPPHKLGFVKFNHDVVAFPGSDTSLATLSAARQTNLTGAGTPIDGIVAGGATSIGDGLEAARTQLVASGPDGVHRAVLLVSDGKENSSQFIADVQASLIADGVRVYPLGLGHGAGIDEAKLTTLADATGGVYRITNDPTEFNKFFIEVLAGAVDWSVSADPVFELAAGDSAEIKVPVAHDETAAVFAAYWQDIADAIDVELVTPAGDLITTTTPAGPSVRVGSDARFVFFKVDFPLQRHAEGSWIGEWTMRLTGRSVLPSGDKVRVSASALAEGGNRLDVAFDKPVYRTGDTVLASARLRRNHRPVPGATVQLQCNIPTAGFGNVLHEGTIGPNDINPDANANGDVISPVYQKLALLEERAGGVVLTRGDLLLTLFDDGAHGDEAAADGVYANSFVANLAGSFSCRFLATDVSTGTVLKTQREWTVAFYNEVAIDPDFSDIDIQVLSQSDDGIIYRVTVVPRDARGNYLGPGYPVTAAWLDLGTGVVRLNDPLVDGTYTGNISLPPPSVGQNPSLTISVGDQPFATLQPPGGSRWSFSVHAGTATPHGIFGQLFDSAPSLSLDLEYELDAQRSIVGFLGFHRFDAATPVLSDTHIVELSANYKYRLNTGQTSPFVIGGLGYYDPKSGSGDMGARLGVGLEFQATPRVSVTVGVDWHRVFSSPDIEFTTANVGIIVGF